MRNKMQDVRDHLVARMEELGNEAADEKAVKNAVERARATVALADSFIDSVKVEIDARKLLQDNGIGLPPALEAPPKEEKPALHSIPGAGRKAS